MRSCRVSKEEVAIIPAQAATLGFVANEAEFPERRLLEPTFPAGPRALADADHGGHLGLSGFEDFFANPQQRAHADLHYTIGVSPARPIYAFGVSNPGGAPACCGAMAEAKDLLTKLVEAGLTQTQIAERLSTTQQSISRWLNGERDPSGPAKKLIRDLAIEMGVLRTRESARHIVPIMGRVGGGASIEPDFEQVPEEGIEQIELPYAISDDLIGFRIVGDSMEPTYEEDAIVVVQREQTIATDSMIGMRAAVLAVLPEGDRRRYLKCIRTGRRHGIFDLESINDRSPPVRDVKIAWASPVRMIIPNIGLRVVRGRARTPRRRN